MFVKLSLKILCLVISVLLSACASGGVHAEAARQVLLDFFEQLSQGNYAAAAERYGGSYENLWEYNPDIDPDDTAALWQHGCQVNGFQCLTIRTATFNEVTAKGETIFTVEFNDPEGNLFVQGACCGEEPTTPPQFQFEYRVVKGGDGVLRVFDMPVYVP